MHHNAPRRLRPRTPSSHAGFKSPFSFSLRFMDEFQWFLIALSVLQGRRMVRRCHTTRGTQHAPSRQPLCDLGPAVTKFLMGFKDDFVLLLCPRVLANGGVEVVVPPAWQSTAC